MKKLLGVAGFSFLLTACGGSGHGTTTTAVSPLALAPDVVLASVGDLTQLGAEAIVIEEPTPGKFTIAGSITDYKGSGLKLKNGSEEITVAPGEDKFQFQTTVISGGTYKVSVSGQPNAPTQSCVVSADEGIATETVKSVIVNCTGDAKFAFVGKLNEAFSTYHYDENSINFGALIVDETFSAKADNFAIIKHPYKGLIYTRQTGANKLLTWKVNEIDGTRLLAGTMDVPSTTVWQDALFNSTGNILIAHPAGKTLYSFDRSHIYVHNLNAAGVPDDTQVLAPPSGLDFYGVALNPPGDTLYTFDVNSDMLHPIEVDPQTGAIGLAQPSIDMQHHINRIAFHPSKKLMYVAGNDDRSLSTYDVSTRFAAVPVDSAPSLLDSAFDLDDLIMDPRGGFVMTISNSTSPPTRSIIQRWAIDAVTGLPSHDVNFAWVPDPQTGELVFVDVLDLTMLGHGDFAGVDPLGKYVYVFISNKLIAFDSAKGQTLTPADIPGGSTGKALLLY